MAENYHFNSQFGLNVTSGGVNSGKAKTVSGANVNKISEIFNNVTGYFQKYENVLSGDVEKEINMYERQAMFVGMNLRASDVKRNFDVSI